MVILFNKRLIKEIKKYKNALSDKRMNKYV